MGVQRTERVVFYPGAFVSRFLTAPTAQSRLFGASIQGVLPEEGMTMHVIQFSSNLEF